MNVNDFAKYVIDNMHRATLANAMNISEKIDNEEYYTFKDFVNSVNAYVSDALQNNKICNIQAYKILGNMDKYAKMYDSDIKYNKRMIIDNMIIELWECYQ